MRTLITLSFIISTCCVHAQNKTIDLYEFLSSAIPDSGQSGIIVSWQKGVSGGTFVKWQKVAPVRGTIGYSRAGMSKIKIGAGKPENISVFLSGDKIGYNEVQLNAGLPEDYQMEKLLGNKSYKAQLIKKDDSGFPTYFYKLKIPGKKEVWCILQAEMPGTAMGDAEMSLDIIILFDYSEFKKRAS